MTAVPAPACRCLVSAVELVEGAGRPRWWRCLEWFGLGTELIVSAAAGTAIRDYSIGRMQLRLTTVARLLEEPLAATGRAIAPHQTRAVLRMARHAGRRVTALQLAQLRLVEALQFGQRDDLSIPTAVARTYGGELPVDHSRPYARRLGEILAAMARTCTFECELRH